MQKENLNIEEEYIDESIKLFNRKHILNRNALNKMNGILGVFLLILSVSLILSTYQMKSEIEDHYVDVESFLSFENKEEFIQFEQQFLLGASDYSLTVESMMLVLSKTDIKRGKIPDVILNFENNINYWVNVIIVCSTSVSIISFFLVNYFSKRSRSYTVSDYNVSNNEYEERKLNIYDEYKTLSIPFLILLIIWSIMFKLNAFNEESSSLFYYNLDLLSVMLNVFYVIGFVFFIWSLVNMFWGAESKEIENTLLKEKEECVEVEKSLKSLQNKIMADKNLLEMFNDKLNNLETTDEQMVAVRNLMSEVRKKNKRIDQLKDESSLNKEFL